MNRDEENGRNIKNSICKSTENDLYIDRIVHHNSTFYIELLQIRKDIIDRVCKNFFNWIYEFVFKLVKCPYNMPDQIEDDCKNGGEDRSGK